MRNDEKRDRIERTEGKVSGQRVTHHKVPGRDERVYKSTVQINQPEGKKLEAGDVEPEEGWLAERKSGHRPGKREERWRPHDNDKPTMIETPLRSEKREGGAKSSSEKAFTDDSVRDELQTVLELDPDLRSYGLKANVVEGEVEIHGIVDTLAEKVRAQELAKKVPGVLKVSNKIAVSTDGHIKDEDVEFEVSEELVKEGVDPKNIGAQTAKGTVTLVGRTDDPDEVERAKKAALRARGVKDLVNKVKLEKE